MKTLIFLAFLLLLVSTDTTVEVTCEACEGGQCNFYSGGPFNRFDPYGAAQNTCPEETKTIRFRCDSDCNECSAEISTDLGSQTYCVG